MPTFRFRSRSRLPQVFDWLVSLPALLVPFFFLPFTPDWLEYNKGLLLLACVLAAATVWFLNTLRERKIEGTGGPFLRLFFVFALVAIIAWLFSPYRYTGLVGVAGFYNHPLWQTLLLVIYLMLVAQLGQGALQRTLRFLVIGSGVVTVYNIFKVYGIELLPINGMGATFNLVTNSSGVLSLVVAVGMLLAIGQGLAESSRGWRVALLALGALNYALLVLLDHQLGWIGAVAGLLILLLTRLAQPGTVPMRDATILSVLTALSIVFLFVPTRSFTQANPSADIILDSGTSTQVTGSVLRREPVFGTGPESFAYDFVRYRPQEFNATPFWNLRFLKARNEMFQLLTSYGIVGTIVFLTPFILLAVFLIHLFLKRGPQQQPWLGALAAAWFSLLFSMLVYPMSFTSAFLLFLLTGALLASLRLRSPQTALRLGNAGHRFLLLAFSLFVIAGGLVVFMGGRLWAAEAAYYGATQSIGAKEDLARVRDRLLRAVNLNNYESKYFFTLSEADLVRAQLEGAKDQPDTELAQNSVREAFEMLQRAVRAEPQYPETYERVADLYATAERLTGSDATGPILEAYRRASVIEPRNPLHPLRFGQTLLTYADSLAQKTDNADQDKQREAERTQALQAARDAFTHVKKLKADLIQADLGLALVLEREGKADEAVPALQRLLNSNPQDVNTWYELGRIERGRGKKDEAIAAFNQVITLMPSSAIARYSLAQIYEEQGKKAEALAAYQEVNKLAPGTTEVQQKIEELSK